MLPLLHPTSTPVPQSLMGLSCNLVLPLSWVFQPSAAAQSPLYPSLHRGRACRDSRSQHAGLCHQLSKPLLSQGGSISRQDLSSLGCSLQSVMAAADAHFFGHP